MNALGILSIVWLAFLAMIGLGLGVVFLGEQVFVAAKVWGAEYRRRCYG